MQGYFRYTTSAWALKVTASFLLKTIKKSPHSNYQAPRVCVHPLHVLLSPKGGCIMNVSGVGEVMLRRMGLTQECCYSCSAHWLQGCGWTPASSAAIGVSCSCRFYDIDWHFYPPGAYLPAFSQGWISVEKCDLIHRVRKRACCVKITVNCGDCKIFYRL